MAPLTLQASALSHTRLVSAQRNNVRTRGAARVQRMAVRPAVAAAEAEVAPEAEAAAAAPTAVPEQRQQRRQGGGNRRPTVGPARTIQISEVEVGKEYDGAVVSIRDFGAFVNIGCQTDGLLHISQISTDFVRSVAEALVNGQEVRVRVLNVDMERGKFAVTMIPEGAAPPPRGSRYNNNDDFADATGERPQLKAQARAANTSKPRSGGGSRTPPPVSPGDVIKGKVQTAAAFGVFVEIGDTGFTGLLHESEMRRAEGEAAPVAGDELEVVVVSVRGDKVALSQRSAEEINQEKEMRQAGISVASDLPSGASPLARQLAMAGLTADKFQAAVGDASS